jgi:hypothetical protein
MTGWYKVEYWHTEQERWLPYDLATNEIEARELLKQAFEWHYAKKVRLVKVTEEVMDEQHQAVKG